MTRFPLTLATVLLLCAATSGDASRTPAETTRNARQLLRDGRTQAAYDALAVGGLLQPRADVEGQPGVLASAAMALQKMDVARPALEVLASTEALPAQARAMVDLRRLEACPACPPPAFELDAVKTLPLAAVTRWLKGLTAAHHPHAPALAQWLLEGQPWTRTDVQPSDRADLLGATWATVRGDPASRPRQLAVWAWENLPTEPATFPLLATLSDDKMVGELGPARSVKHLEALLDGNANEPAIAFGSLLCTGGVTAEDKVCPALKDATLACQAAFAVGKAQRQARQYPAAEATLSVVAAASGCTDQAPRAMFLQGKSVAAQKDGALRAVGVFEELAKKYPQHRLADDALTQAGQLSARHQNKKAALKLWQQVLSKFADGDQAGDAAWWLAWEARAAGKTTDAQKRMDAMKATLGDRAVLPWRRALYWRARTEDDAAKAVALLRDVVESQPQTWEAALARGQLQRRDETLPVFTAWDATPEPAVAPSTMDTFTQAALALEKLGLDLDAAWLLRASSAWSTPVATADGGTTPPADLWMAQALLRTGDAPYVSRFIRGRYAVQLRSTPVPSTHAQFRLAYPQAHASAIEGAAAAEGIPASLLYALAREESAFDARITSWAGAIGLTQLMPATGVMEAKALGMPKPSNVALLEPTLNARLGASHLARDLREFNGNAALALAAYNAGPGNVRAWLKRAGPMDLDEFVETIPIDETRGYVKRVLESWGIYRLLRGEGPLVIPRKPLDRMVDL